jgi:hypothetical protein
MIAFTIGTTRTHTQSHNHTTTQRTNPADNAIRPQRDKARNAPARRAGLQAGTRLPVPVCATRCAQFASQHTLTKCALRCGTRARSTTYDSMGSRSSALRRATPSLAPAEWCDHHPTHRTHHHSPSSRLSSSSSSSSMRATPIAASCAC